LEDIRMNSSARQGLGNWRIIAVVDIAKAILETSLMMKNSR
jgi:hypothetical protein